MIRRNKSKWIGRYIVSRIIGFAFMTFIVMHLWNVLAPDLFNLHPIRYLQALGLMILTRLLTWPINLRHRMGRGMSMHRGKQLMERWHQMKEEDRKAWVEKIRQDKG